MGSRSESLEMKVYGKPKDKIGGSAPDVEGVPNYLTTEAAYTTFR